MSFLISTACMRLKMSGIPKNVLMQLAEMANDHGYAWPSIEFLCMRTDWSRSSVIEALNFLESQKVIWRDKSSGRHTRYWVTPANWEGERHTIRDADQSTTRTGPPPGRVRNLDPTRPQSGRDPSTTRTLIPLNTNEPNTPQPPAGGQPGFDEFFVIFPKQVDEAKARDQWNRLAPDDALRAAIMASVLEWRSSVQWQKEGGSLIPKPHNWLRNKGWRNVAGVAPLPAKPTAPPPMVAPAAPMPAHVAAAAARLLGPKAKSSTVRASALAGEGALHGTD